MFLRPCTPDSLHWPAHKYKLGGRCFGPEANKRQAASLPEAEASKSPVPSPGGQLGPARASRDLTVAYLPVSTSLSGHFHTQNETARRGERPGQKGQSGFKAARASEGPARQPGPRHYCHQWPLLSAWPRASYRPQQGSRVRSAE